MTKAKKDTAATTKTVEEAVNAGREAWQGFIATGADNYEKAVADAGDQWKKATTSYEEFAAVNKENVEAVVEVTTVYAKGVEAIGAQWMAFGKAMVESQVKATQDAFGAASLKDAMDLQNDSLKSSYENWVAQSTKISEMTQDLAKKVSEPMNERVSETVAKMTKAAA